MSPNSAEAVAREPLKDWREQQPTLEQGALWLLSRAKNYPKKRALELLAEALRDERHHATQQVREAERRVWEEAARALEQWAKCCASEYGIGDKTTRFRAMELKSVAKSFRRRVQEGKE